VLTLQFLDAICGLVSTKEFIHFGPIAFGTKMFSCYDQFQPKELNLSQSQEITTLRIKEVDCDFTVQPLQSRKAKKHWVGSTTWQSHAPATSPTKQKHVYSPSYLKQLHCQPLPSWPKACKAQIAKTVWKKH